MQEYVISPINFSCNFKAIFFILHAYGLLIHRQNVAHRFKKGLYEGPTTAIPGPDIRTFFDFSAKQ